MSYEADDKLLKLVTRQITSRLRSLRAEEYQPSLGADESDAKIRQLSDDIGKLRAIRIELENIVTQFR